MSISGISTSSRADTIAAAFATENPNVRLQQLESSLQAAGFAANTVQDQVVGVNYGIRVAPWFVLRPGLQLVINPGGVKANPAAGVIDPPRNALVIGPGGYLSF